LAKELDVDRMPDVDVATFNYFPAVMLPLRVDSSNQDAARNRLGNYLDCIRLRLNLDSRSVVSKST